jgi:hypothetical protein
VTRLPLFFRVKLCDSWCRMRVMVARTRRLVKPSKDRGDLHFTGDELNQLLSVYGYRVVMLFVGLESIGMPMPGKTMLIAASIHAGTTRDLDIALVIAAASCGAVLKMAILGEAFARAGSSTSAAPPRIRPPPMNHNRFIRFNFFSDGLIVRYVWRHSTAPRDGKHVETSQC